MTGFIQKIRFIFTMAFRFHCTSFIVLLLLFSCRDHYESESFNYNGTTTKTPPETPTSNNTDSPSRSGVMSPMPGDFFVVVKDLVGRLRVLAEFLWGGFKMFASLPTHERTPFACQVCDARIFTGFFMFVDFNRAHGFHDRLRLER